jgi:hypothetical protein
MINFTPDVIVTKKKMKKVTVSGPRAETLMLIRYFARTYEFEPEQKRKERKSLVN